MDTVKKNIAEGRYSREELEALEEVLDRALRRIRDKEEKRKKERDIGEAWAWIFNRMKEHAGEAKTSGAFLPVLAHMGATDGLWDIRLWEGYYIGKHSIHCAVRTTPYLYHKGIYQTTTQWHGEVDGRSGPPTRAECLAAIAEVGKRKASELWRHVECPTCYDDDASDDADDSGSDMSCDGSAAAATLACKCTELDALDDAAFRALLDATPPVIKVRCDSETADLDEAFVTIVMYYLFESSKEYEVPEVWDSDDHHFEELDY